VIVAGNTPAPDPAPHPVDPRGAPGPRDATGDEGDADEGAQGTASDSARRLDEL